jgi:hypothetical protein
MREAGMAQSTIGIGGTAIAAVSLTIISGLAIRNFASTRYAGYEVGLMRGVIIVSGLLALGAWLLLAILIRRAR